MDGASNKGLVSTSLHEKNNNDTLEIKNWSEKTINNHYWQILSEWSNRHIAIRYEKQLEGQHLLLVEGGENHVWFDKRAHIMISETTTKTTYTHKSFVIVKDAIVIFVVSDFYFHA